MMSTAQQSTNHFSGITQQVHLAPPNQRAAALINGIAQQLQQSDNPTTKQLGEELQSLKIELAQSCQQG